MAGTSFNPVFNAATAFNPAFKSLFDKSLNLPATYASPAVATSDTGTSSTADTVSNLFSNPVPSIDPAAKAAIDYQTALEPLNTRYLINQANIQRQLNIANLQDTYPYVAQAAQQSKLFDYTLGLKAKAAQEGFPSNIQKNIITPKQEQIASAADAEYRRALGMAAQQDAATNFARRYAGQTFSTA